MSVVRWGQREYVAILFGRPESVDVIEYGDPWHLIGTGLAIHIDQENVVRLWLYGVWCYCW